MIKIIKLFVRIFFHIIDTFIDFMSFVLDKELPKLPKIK